MKHIMQMKQQTVLFFFVLMLILTNPLLLQGGSSGTKTPVQTQKKEQVQKESLTSNVGIALDTFIQKQVKKVDTVLTVFHTRHAAIADKAEELQGRGIDVSSVLEKLDRAMKRIEYTEAMAKLPEKTTTRQQMFQMIPQIHLQNHNIVDALSGIRASLDKAALTLTRLKNQNNLS